MRIPPISAVVGSVLLIGLISTFPAAGQSTQSSQPAASSRVAAAADWKTEREAYVRKARDEVQEWQRKQHDFREKTRNSEANITTRKHFNMAWTEVEDASRKLETAGAEDWESAKGSFYKASQRLAAVWEKIKSQDK
jgi:hypothetical protein